MTGKGRAMIHSLYLLDAPDEETLARFESAYGQHIIKIQEVQHWTSKFRSGKADLDDQPRPGRPQQNAKLQVIRTMTEGNPSMP
jgi:hypothetical protein